KKTSSATGLGRPIHILFPDRGSLIRNFQPAAVLFHVDTGKPVLPADFRPFVNGLLNDLPGNDRGVAVHTDVEIREVSRVKPELSRLQAGENLRLLLDLAPG